jgi:hypothetical protein
MKWILFLSLLLNGVLIVLLIREKARPPLERIIIETVQLRPKELPAETSKTPEKEILAPEAPNKSPSPGPEVMRSMREKKDNTRKDFLMGELGFSEEDLAQMARLKELHQLEIEKVMRSDKSQDGQFSLSSRKKLINLEQRYLENVRKFLGPSRWERYERFRAEFNQRGSEESENVPFVFMEP